MAGRDDAIRPVSATRLDPMKPEREPPARPQPDQPKDEAEQADAARYDAYRVILDPETLRAVAQVRDPRTGEVMFTVPAGAELSETAKERFGDDEENAP